MKYPRSKVVFGEDGSATDVSALAPLPVQEAGVATSTLTSVAFSADSVTLLAANTSRRMAMIYNDANAVLHLKLGEGASTSSYTVQLPSSSYYELPHPVYTGTIDGIWITTGEAPVGGVQVTELT